MKKAVDERVQELIDRLPEELLEAWQERSAIREYDGGFSRPHAEALALLDLLESEPDLLSNVRAYRVDVDDEPRFFATSSEELLREHAELLGGEIAARRSVAWVLDEEYGGLAEITAVA
jgi:5'-deoxynucleotidase YfbR-like HD superfamily hydrolase